MIISVTSLKGGVGKSTITQNLAVTFAHIGHKVCIVDADTNQSSMKWSGLREEDRPNIMVTGQQDDNALLKNVKLLNQDYDIVLIDGTPSLSKTTSKILLLADLVVIPILPSGLDFWATELFLERFEEAKSLREQEIPAYFLLNQHDERYTLGREAREALSAFEGIKVFDSFLKSRTSYRKAVIEGLGVYEYSDPKAKEEMVNLTNEIQTVLAEL
jgi:chromosome partitioning protein